MYNYHQIARVVVAIVTLGVIPSHADEFYVPDWAQGYADGKDLTPAPSGKYIDELRRTREREKCNKNPTTVGVLLCRYDID
jgi:hypothetical protein